MSTYSSNLKIELIGTGEQSGTWGTTSNSNFSNVFEQAIVGRVTVPFIDIDVTLIATNSVASQDFRNVYLNCTGTNTASKNLIVPPINKNYIVENNTTGGFSIVVKTAAGTGITVPNGFKCSVYVDGTNVVQAFNYFPTINMGALTASTGAFTNLTSTTDATLSGVRVGKGAGSISSNTALGSSALNSNTTGSDNTASGVNALANNTTGSGNTASGQNALYYNTTGTQNTANGQGALFNNTTGNFNTANGFQALVNNTTGSNNTANGVGALSSNTTGNFNTASGQGALNSNTTGLNNTASGMNALYYNTTGTSNTANGQSALFNNTTGYSNTTLGYQAGVAITTGSGNTILGAGLPGTTTLTNTVLIGADSTERMRIDSAGNVGIGTTSPSGKLSVSSSSYPTGTVESSSTNLAALSFTNSNAAATTWAVGVQGGQYQTAGKFSVNLSGVGDALTIDSSRNVGIGTSSPSKKLEVYAASNSLQIQSVVHNDQAGSGVAAIGFNVSSGAAGDTSASKAGIGLQRGASQGVGPLCFYNSASTDTADFTTSDERMRIDSSGNLLVGTTSQIGAEKLNVTSGVANATTYTTVATRGGSSLYVQQQQTTSVSTVATVILNPSLYVSLCLVHGSDGTNRFVDLVMFSIGSGTLNVISSLSASGDPASRTYSQSSSTYRVAMGSGTYTVQVAALSMSS